MSQQPPPSTAGAALPPPYPLIKSLINQGRVIPFLGSGASLGGRGLRDVWQHGVTSYLPTAGELAAYLAGRTAFPDSDTTNLTKVAQYYDAVGGRLLLDEELRGIFNNDYDLTTLHTFLADAPVPLLIVTTNYDDCIERAFDARQREYDQVIHKIDEDRVLWWQHGASKPLEVLPKKIVIDLNARTVIYKMHGAIDRTGVTRDQYLITEDDYVDFLARMTRNTAIPAIFAEPFSRRSFLFLGYSLGDWNLRVIWNRIDRDWRRSNSPASWAIRYLVTPLEERFWLKRGVQTYNMTIDEFMKNLMA